MAHEAIFYIPILFLFFFLSLSLGCVLCWPAFMFSLHFANEKRGEKEKKVGSTEARCWETRFDCSLLCMFWSFAYRSFNRWRLFSLSLTLHVGNWQVFCFSLFYSLIMFDSDCFLCFFFENNSMRLLFSPLVGCGCIFSIYMYKCWRGKMASQHCYLTLNEIIINLISKRWQFEIDRFF